MKVRFAMLLAVLLVAANFAYAADGSPLLATEPTISKTEIVFAYGGYLWSVPRAGGEARQLTTGGHESSPYFSPDGKLIAFTGQYDGNEDVYVMSEIGQQNVLAKLLHRRAGITRQPVAHDLFFCFHDNYFIYFPIGIAAIKLSLRRTLLLNNSRQQFNHNFFNSLKR